MKKIAQHIYLKLKFLLTQPSEAWKEFSEENNEKYIRTMIFPMLCVVVFCMFLGQIVSAELNMGKLTLESFLLFFSYLFGFYISKWVLHLFLSDVDEEKCAVLVAYSYSVMLLTDMFSAFLNDEDLVRFLFYVVAVFLLYKSEPVFNYSQKENVKYVSYTTLSIVVVPFVLRKLLGLFMVSSDTLLAVIMKFLQ